MDAVALTLLFAYLLDLAVGDPRWLPHPVRGLGWCIRKGEKILRDRIRNESWAGWFLVIGIVGGTLLLVRGLLLGAQALSPRLAFPLEVFLLYVCLSTRDLAVESWPVYRALKSQDLPRARRCVAMIVGRDTDALSESEVVRATAETIGESLMDGIIAPLFYAAMGGVPLACVYKAVNTLDSMVGYRSARYLKFGRSAAKVDSWMNWIPARITALLIAAAGQIVGFSGLSSLKALFRDAWNRNENSWIPEAAMAGALGVQLGGSNFYQGKVVETPHLGDPRKPLAPIAIPQAIRIMYSTSVLGFLAALLVRWGLQRIWV
ncbi:MAG: cobalamin biosynthesis protein CobD [Candidatus Omnitrophica bacterium]|nr:cobalamin biosynthesis protein CobD [Candidatus Omnitrophota bacterium]